MAVEEPHFKLQARDGLFEVRAYPALTVAEVTVGGDQKQAVSAGFRLLAGYIFGANARGEKIAMTAPVTQLPAAGNVVATTPVVDIGAVDRWVVRFTMPQRFRADALPRPRDGRVRLQVVPPIRVAVLRFSGLAQKDEVRAKALDLAAWVRARRLRQVGPVSLAQYDPPWTLWFLRRNEVMIPLAP